MGHGSESLPLGRLGACSSEQSLVPERELLHRDLLETKSSFYGGYGWCLP